MIKTVSAIWELNTSKEILLGNTVEDYSTKWCIFINASLYKGFDLIVYK